MRLAILLFLSLLLGCAGIPVVAPTSKMTPLPQLMAPAAPSTNKQHWLVWDSSPDITNFAVYTGPARNQWTNRIVVGTNAVIYQQGVFYGVASFDAPAESSPAFWPSNRIAELWLTGYGAGLTQSTNVAKLLVFTNDLPGNMQFWGVEDRTIRWE